MEKKKKFLKLPQLDGGKELLKKFVKDNLQYPKEALEKQIQGDVIVKYKVNGLGEVFDAFVVHGIGHGCDEEALRLVGMLNYEAVKNRGVKVTSNNRIKISFRLPPKPKQAKMKIVYKPQVIEATPASKEKPAQKKPETYSYTVKL